MSSQSTADASETRYVASMVPSCRNAKRRGASPESLWAKSTPGCLRLTARPESSTASGERTVPVRASRSGPHSAGPAAKAESAPARARSAAARAAAHARLVADDELARIDVQQEVAVGKPLGRDVGGDLPPL